MSAGAKIRSKHSVKGKNMSQLTRMIIIVTIVVSVTDTIVFWKIKQHPERITVGFVILVILVTVIPICFNFWYHFLKR